MTVSVVLMYQYILDIMEFFSVQWSMDTHVPQLLPVLFFQARFLIEHRGHKQVKMKFAFFCMFVFLSRKGFSVQP